MKYRIVKYDLFPSYLEDENSPTYAIEYKRHWWSRWKSLYRNDCMGINIPKLISKSEALERFYSLTGTTCLQCKHCYGRVGESEWAFRRCKIQKEKDGAEKVLYGSPDACSLFQRRDGTDYSCGDCKFLYHYQGSNNKLKGGNYCQKRVNSVRVVVSNEPICNLFERKESCDESK